MIPGKLGSMLVERAARLPKTSFRPPFGGKVRPINCSDSSWSNSGTVP